MDNNPPEIPKKYRPRGVDVLYEDREVLVANKEAGVLTVGTGLHDERTAYSALVDYVRKGQSKSRKGIFIIHRLDRETSGVLIFAKTVEAKHALQADWEQTRKTYLALVEGNPDKDEGTISTYLAENTALRVYSTPDRRKGKLARTQYRVLRRIGTRALLEVTLLTGRKHQIRVHLSEQGWPIVGDGKYGDGTGGKKRLALHAFRIEFTHPQTGKRMRFEAPLPTAFQGWMGRAARAEKS